MVMYRPRIVPQASQRNMRGIKVRWGDGVERWEHDRRGPTLQNTEANMPKQVLPL